MQSKEFWTGLAISALSSGAIIGLILFLIPSLRIYGSFSLGSIALFCVLSVLVFFAGNSAAKSKNKLAFNNLVLGSVFAKLVLTLFVLFLYKKGANPTDGWYAVLFLLIYGVFTTFEVMFLTKQAKQ